MHILTSVSHDLTLSGSGLGVLTSDLVAPVVSETSVGSDLLESLNIVSELDIKLVNEQLGVLTVGKVSLSVKEPSGNLVLTRVLDDSNDSLELLNGELTSSLGEIDISLLADQVGVSSTNTLDLAHGVHDLDSAVNVSVEESVLVVEWEEGEEGKEMKIQQQTAANNDHKDSNRQHRQHRQQYTTQQPVQAPSVVCVVCASFVYPSPSALIVCVQLSAMPEYPQIPPAPESVSCISNISDHSHIALYIPKDVLEVSLFSDDEGHFGV